MSSPFSKKPRMIEFDGTQRILQAKRAEELMAEYRRRLEAEGIRCGKDGTADYDAIYPANDKEAQRCEKIWEELTA